MPAELHIRKRVLTLLVLLIFLFGVLVCRIAYLTTARSAELTSRACASGRGKERSMPAGAIFWIPTVKRW